MTYYALTDIDWPFDDQDEGRAIVVQADTPELAVQKATAMHIAEQGSGAGGVTWVVAALSDVGLQSVEWTDDGTQSSDTFLYFSEDK